MLFCPKSRNLLQDKEIRFYMRWYDWPRITISIFRLVLPKKADFLIFIIPGPEAARGPYPEEEAWTAGLLAR
jgi:hypothetical protein